MAKLKPRPWTARDYERAAEAYLRRLPLEHFMEAVPAATQRKITLESFDLLQSRCPEVQCFNELLIQYWYKGRVRRVVPDNFVRKCERPPVAELSFNLDLEKVGPLLVMEYVSASNLRKDYKTNFVKYERELKVPYYLLFYPEQQDLRLYHLKERRYEPLTANGHGRLAIPDLELAAGLRDGWVRFWHKGELLALPADLQRQLDRERQRAEQEKQRADRAEAEVTRLQALLDELQNGKRPPKRPRANGSP